MNKTTYEILLRQQDEDELIVDVRKTIEDHRGEEVSDEYTEGYSFTESNFYERYRKAKREMVRLTNKYTGKMVEDDLNHPDNEHTVIESDEIFIDAENRIEALEKIKDDEEKSLDWTK